jgi:hypothetical protein
MHVARCPRVAIAIAAFLLSLLSTPSFSQEGRPGLGHDPRRGVHDAAEEVGRRDDRRRSEELRPDERRQQEERRPEGQRRVDEKRPDESRVTDVDEAARKIDLTKRYNDEKLDADALAAKIKADEIGAERTAPDEDRTKTLRDTIDHVTAHAYEEHWREYGNISRDEFRQIAKEHLENPDDKTNLYNNHATAYWSEKYKSVLIVNHDSPEKSTMFKPDDGQSYYELLKKKYGSN